MKTTNIRFFASLLILFAISFSTVQAQLDQDLTQGYYRLKTMFRGDGECLEGNQAGSDYHNGAAFMDKCQNVSGQMWKFEDAGNGYYRLKTMFRGDGECLEGNQAGSKVHNGSAFMDKCQNVSGQLWKVEPAGNGYYRLKTMFRGDGECLEGNQASSKVHGGNAFMDKCQNVSGQLWKFVAVEQGKQTKIEVLKATWGVKGRTADVTARVQELVASGQTRIEARNHILGADPAKGVSKTLTVTFKKDGREQTKSVAERQYFTF